MIVVTRLNDSRFAINPDLIERIHANPDTTIVMVDGSTYIVTESMEAVIDRIAGYRAQVIALARDVPPGAAAPAAVPVSRVQAVTDENAHSLAQAVPLRRRT
jgi:uncharacterized protein YlzI (FlbEa/FlbD family)